MPKKTRFIFRMSQIKSLIAVLVCFLTTTSTQSQELELGAELLRSEADRVVFGKGVFLNLQYPIIKELKLLGGARLSIRELEMTFRDEDNEKSYYLQEDEFTQLHLQLGIRYFLSLIKWEFNQQVGLYGEVISFFEPFPNRKLYFDKESFDSNKVEEVVKIKGESGSNLDFGMGAGIYYKRDDLCFILRVQSNSIDTYKAFRTRELINQPIDDKLPKAGQIAVGISMCF